MNTINMSNIVFGRITIHIYCFVAKYDSLCQYSNKKGGNV